MRVWELREALKNVPDEALVETKLEKKKEDIRRTVIDAHYGMRKSYPAFTLELGCREE